VGYAFISYSTKKQDAAEAMRNLLKKNQIEVWMAPWDIPVGSRYADVITKAIKNCSCVVLMLSKASQESIWVSKEVERAVSYRKPIVPVQIEDVVLTDEFELYISTDQIVAVSKIAEDSEEIKKIIRGVSGFIKDGTNEGSTSADILHVEEKDSVQNGEFQNLLKTLYNKLIEYRSAFRSGDGERINAASNDVSAMMQQMFSLCEECQLDNEELSNKANEIVVQYDRYVERYMDFVKELRRKYGKKSNELAAVAEEEFKRLMDIVKGYIEKL